MAIVADVPAFRPTIWIQHAEEVIERVVFLQHEEDMVDGIAAASRRHCDGRVR